MNPNPTTAVNQQASCGLRPLADFLENDAEGFLRQSLESTPNSGAWLKLYTASQTLLSAMQQDRVAAALVEISSNLLGCEEVAIVEIGGDPTTIHFLGEEGLSPEDRQGLIQNGRFLGPMITPGECWIPWDQERSYSPLIPRRINALIPLWNDERSSGAMLLFELLPQRNGFDAEDREVLQLLALYAGPCLRSRTRE